MKLSVKPEQVMLAVAAAAAVAFLAGGLRKAGGLPAPATATTEGGTLIPEPIQGNLCLPPEHTGETIFSKHRYPDKIGGEITTVIHYGHSAISVPDVSGGQWITAPPSEVTL